MLELVIALVLIVFIFSIFLGIIALIFSAFAFVIGLIISIVTNPVVILLVIAFIIYCFYIGKNKRI